MNESGHFMRPNVGKVWFVIGIPLAIVVGTTLALWMKDQATDHHWDGKVEACVTEMQARELGHSMGDGPCEALNDAGKHEAAYRWAQRRGAL